MAGRSCISKHWWRLTQLISDVQPIWCSLWFTAAWGDWSTWGSCSTTCGNGTKIRTQECLSNDFTNASCDGKQPKEEQSCSDGQCRESHLKQFYSGRNLWTFDFYVIAITNTISIFTKWGRQINMGLSICLSKRNLVLPKRLVSFVPT